MPGYSPMYVYVSVCVCVCVCQRCQKKSLDFSSFPAFLIFFPFWFMVGFPIIFN